MLLSKKSIISINEEFDNGNVINEGSLDFAINMAKKSDNWLKSLALLVRAILIDHIFEDGNKRTAAAVIVTWLEMENLHCNLDKVNKLIVKILKKNITNLNEIMEQIKNAAEE
jgi:prophage maintenance system killer protein